MMVNVPENCLTAVGVKTTVTVQLVFAAREAGEAGQLLVSPKLLLSPVMDRPEISKGALPVLVSVSVMGALGVFMF